VGEISFLYERTGAMTRFEKEAEGNSGMVNNLQSVVKNPNKHATNNDG